MVNRQKNRPRHPPAWRWFAGMLVAGVVGQGKEGDARVWEQLISRSPFGGAAQAVAAVPEGGTTLEFRGLVVMDQRTFFRIDEPARNRGAWLALGQAENGVLVKHHDPVGETITVEFRGQTQVLPWRAGQVVNAPADMPPPGVDLVPPRYIRNGLQNQSLLREELEPQHMDNEWFREFVRKYGPPVFRTAP